MLSRIVKAVGKYVIAIIIGAMSVVGINGNPDGIIQGLPFRLMTSEQVQQIETDAYNDGYSKGVSTYKTSNTSSTAKSYKKSALKNEFPKTMYVATEEGLYLRTGPGTNNEAIGVIEYGQDIWVNRIENGWAYTSIGGYTGYCSAEYLTDKPVSNEYEQDNNQTHKMVYYTEHGECYHKRDCYTISRSKTIYSGDINEVCNYRRPCEICMP